MNVDGNDQKQLTFGGVSSYPSVSPDGRYLVFASVRTGAHQIWRMNIDGSNPTQLTNGSRESWPACSPDGRWVVYVSFAPTPLILSKAPVDGGNPIKLSDKPSNLPAFSPDGKLLAFRYSETAGSSVFKIGVMSFEDGRRLALSRGIVNSDIVVISNFK